NMSELRMMALPVMGKPIKKFAQISLAADEAIASFHPVPLIYVRVEHYDVQSCEIQKNRREDGDTLGGCWCCGAVYIMFVFAFSHISSTRCFHNFVCISLQPVYANQHTSPATSRSAHF
ncbi:MAG: hypothetical protein OCU16_03495, partial [Candidatus Methanospirare jalkutatii]|nr:hypothetical protein [Candidatus Methanospirare jalkutatii]